jgi:hypothetical protein
VANIPRAWCGNLQASGDVAMAGYGVGLLMIALDGKNHGLWVTNPQSPAGSHHKVFEGGLICSDPRSWKLGLE